MLIKDISLAPSGHDKIDWVRPAMPVLAGVEQEFLKTKPLKGLKMSISIHLEAKTAYLAHVLRSGGADVAVTGCNPLSTQDDVAAALADDGFDVYGVTGRRWRNTTAIFWGRFPTSRTSSWTTAAISPPFCMRNVPTLRRS